MTLTLIVLSVTAALFVWGRWRADFVAICALLVLVVADILTPEEALAGFANPVVAMMVGLFVVGGGLFSTGLAKMVGSRILGMAGTNESRLFVWLMAATALVGAFVSNTGTVALLLPIVVSMTKAAGLPASRYLMPMAFAGSMGGMLTLIGTPPNLIVRDVLAGEGYAPLTFFSFTPVGLVCIAVGVAVLLPLSKRFLGHSRVQPEKWQGGKSPEELAEEYGVAAEMVRLSVPAGSAIIGRNVQDLRVQERYGLNLTEVRRLRKETTPLLRQVTQYAAGEACFAAGDVVYATGPEQGVRLFATDWGLEVRGGRVKRRNLKFYDVGMAEALLLPGSRLTGKTLAEVGFRTQYGLNVLGIRRGSRYLRSGLKDCRLQAADIILVQGPWSNIARLPEAETRFAPGAAGTGVPTAKDFVVLGEPLAQAARVTLDYKAPLATLIMLLMVVTMAVDSIPVAPVTAVMLAAVAMVATGCVRGVEAAYKTINWESIILFGAMLPMSTALSKTGASAMVAHSLADACGGSSPYVLLAAVYAVTSLLTFFISNTVTAVLMAPIALTAATTSGISAVPLLMAVTVAASMCFASPFSTPPNALVMSAGSYRTIDYIKVGLPLQVVMAVAMIAVLPWLFPF